MKTAKLQKQGQMLKAGRIAGVERQEKKKRGQVATDSVLGNMKKRGEKELIL